MIRQEVKVGAVNETHGIVYAGLKKGDEVLLTTPADTSGISFVTLTATAVAPKAGEDAKWKQRWAQFQSANLVAKPVNTNRLPVAKIP